MFYLNVLQNQRILLALGAGFLLTLGMALAYLDFWRPRREESGAAPAEGRRPGFTGWLVSFVPWALALIVAGAGIWGFLYTLHKVVYPPNW